MRLAWLGLLPWLGTGALADPPGPDAAGVLAASCYGCHGGGAPRTGGIPRLTSLSREDIADTLLAYRADQLQGTLMNRIARGYTEAEIRLLADHFGTPSR